MTRYIAFLRAINIGGHTVKMETLRSLFESFGFSEVETFLASGNVIFESPEQDHTALESMIASRLHKALGYEVATFIRTGEELAKIAAYQAFLQSEVDSSTAYNIAFLSGPFNDQAKQKLMALRTDIDVFAVYACEVYWLCRRKQSESTFSNAVLEKTLSGRSTLRGINTVRKLAARVAGED